MNSDLAVETAKGEIEEFTVLAPTQASAILKVDHSMNVRDWKRNMVARAPVPRIHFFKMEDLVNKTQMYF